MNDHEFEGNLEGSSYGLFKVLFHNLTGGTEENHKNLSLYLVFWPRYFHYKVHMFSFFTDLTTISVAKIIDTLLKHPSLIYCRKSDEERRIKYIGRM
jgi:hypothetical protein